MSNETIPIHERKKSKEEISSSAHKENIQNARNKIKETINKMESALKVKKKKSKASKNDWFCNICEESREKRMIQCLR